jgi:hypothetical protein|tara:strand:+ start:711 stop:1130 length:420 start_codon:yes stop_codon:yes gene_type:complete
MTILQAILLGIFTGSLTTTGIILGAQMRSDRLQAIQLAQDNALKEMALISAHIQKEELEIQKNLTAPDLLEVACSEAYLKDNTDLLCRELFCRLQTREGDGASQVECESMSNIANSLVILEACKDTQFDECIDLFERRK